MTREGNVAVAARVALVVDVSVLLTTVGADVALGRAGALALVAICALRRVLYVCVP